MIYWIIGVLYSFGIGFYFGALCKERMEKENKKVNDFDTPCDAVFVFFTLPIIAMVWSIYFFFTGKGLGERND